MLSVSGRAHERLTIREVGIVLVALGISTIPSWPWVPSCPGLISWVATPRSAIQAVQLGLGEKIDVCILLRTTRTLS